MSQKRVVKDQRGQGKSQKRDVMGWRIQKRGMRNWKDQRKSQKRIVTLLPTPMTSNNPLLIPFTISLSPHNLF